MFLLDFTLLGIYTISQAYLMCGCPVTVQCVVPKRDTYTLHFLVIITF